MKIKSLGALTAFAIAVAAPLAGNAAPEPVHVRGTIAAVSPSSITVTTAKGPVVLGIAAATHIVGALPASAADIKPGTFVGIANVEGSGPARALEVVVFPDAMRGTGEGDYAWDLPASGGHGSAMTNGTVSAAPHGSMMTNATVKTVGSGAVRVISVAYKGGTKRIAIGPNAPVVRVEPGTAKLFLSGAHVFAAALPKGHAFATLFVVVGERGTVPPM
jgi:hypothetical protein